MATGRKSNIPPFLLFVFATTITVSRPAHVPLLSSTEFSKQFQNLRESIRVLKMMDDEFVKGMIDKNKVKNN